MWFTTRSTVTCFYCNTSLSLVRRPTQDDLKGKQRQLEGLLAVGTHADFECLACGCRNLRDDNDEIISQHVPSPREALTPRHRDSVPSSPSPFCRQCLSNQSLQIHLLSSYPSSSDEDEEGPSDPLEETFPPMREYRQSLDRRYPLVCRNCEAQVDQIVRERDYKVKADVLGTRLKATTALPKEELDTAASELRKWLVAGIIWRIRACLWGATHLLTIITVSGNLVGLTDLPRAIDPMSLRILLLSPLWNFWDPTWNRVRIERRARGASRLRIRHRELYIAGQGLSYCGRLAFSITRQFSFLRSQWPIFASLLSLVSFLALIAPFWIPRATKPPPILLKSTDSPHRHPSTPTKTTGFATSPLREELDPLEPLEHLSLSRKSSLFVPNKRVSIERRLQTQTIQRTKSSVRDQEAKFGQPAFGGSSSNDLLSTSFPDNLRANLVADDQPRLMDYELESEVDNSMDWTPSSPAGGSSRQDLGGGGGGIRFRPRKFVVPDFGPPTGLERVLEQFGIGSAPTSTKETPADKMQVDGADDKADVTLGPVGAWWQRWTGRARFRDQG